MTRDTRWNLDSIPHRPPFCFLDQIIEATDRSIVAGWTPNDSCDFFRGHYPGNPIVPGVLLCESCFQAGALLMARDASPSPSGVPVVTRINEARFRRIVRPNETLRIEVTRDDAVDNAWYMTGRVTHNDQVCARVSFVCMLSADTNPPIEPPAVGNPRGSTST